MKMRYVPILLVVMIIAVSISMLFAAKKPVTSEEWIKLAESAAPTAIAKDATVLIPGADGKLVEAKKGTNGFTCLPDLADTPALDPICLDQAANQWVASMMNNEPKPANTVPGISYMAKGGQHWEKDGKILMKKEEGSKLVNEPAHWMVMWPFDEKLTGLPVMPNPSGVYIMFAGTPYAHLMVYQDPMKMKTK